MKPSLFLPSLSAVLLLAPVLTLAQPQDAPPPNLPRNPPNARRDAPQPRGDGQGPNRMGARRDMKAELGLTDFQQAEIEKAMHASRRERLLKTTDLKVANLDLRSLLRADKTDEKAIGAKLAEAQAAQGALLKLKVDSALALKRILTPEQQKKMREMRRGQGRSRMNQGMRAPRSPGTGRSPQGMSMRMRPGRPGMGNPGDDSDFDPDEFDLDEGLDEGNDRDSHREDIR